MKTQQKVLLSEGSFHGRVVDAPPPPDALRLSAAHEGEVWTELYLYELGGTDRDPETGELLPVMRFVERRTEGGE